MIEPGKQPMHRSILLAFALLFFSILLYGYGREFYDNFSWYSLPALFHTYPENFRNDALSSFLTDRHPVYTFFLEQIFKTAHQGFWLFLFFTISKFLLFLGIIRIANTILSEKFLFIMSGIFLFPGIEFNLQYGGNENSFAMATPRLIATGFFLLGFSLLLERKKIFAAILFGVSSLIHMHFTFLCLPVVILSECTAIYNSKKISYKNLISPFVYFTISLPIIINSFLLSKILFDRMDLIKEVYIDTVTYYHFEPNFFLKTRSLLFLIFLIPFLFYKKILLEKEKKMLWYFTVLIILVGTVICIIFTYIFIHPFPIFIWYGGHTSFVSLTSFIFILAIIESGWDRFSLLKKYTIAACVYLASIVPFVGITLFQFTALIKTIREKKTVIQFAINLFVLIVLFMLSPFLTDYFSQFYVLPKALGRQNFQIPKELYVYIKNNTDRSSIFLVPPLGFDGIRSIALRSVVVDAKTHFEGEYLQIWKDRMLELSGDNMSTLTKTAVTSNAVYFKKSPDEITAISKKYKANYFVTGIVFEDKFKNSKNFELIFKDKNYVLYKIIL
ncbi:MAG: hypothetical protein US74_C0028G0001 [Parcubacteria group bacterium GW2011_GWA2_38_13]|nr:MAG: hypothetical protein US74_C0028G0001 [Parcubacteria group bacterium GW2011_GWA2_38_13]